MKKKQTRRSIKKWVKHVLHQARHARHMRSDIASPEELKALDESEQALMQAWANKAPVDEVDRLVDLLSEHANKVYPPRSHPGLRENIEIIAVAICIAMAFRTYFIQPFKIPTGSMQPTLYGIQVDGDAVPTWVDKYPMRLVKFMLTGQRFVEVKAQTSGTIVHAIDRVNRQELLFVDPNPNDSHPGVPHDMVSDMKRHFNNGNVVAKGQVIASGMVTAGDHIFVNKIRYNFSKPNRGDIVVFRTEDINHPDIRKTDHYIKRLVGLPGEEVQIDPPYLVVNRNKIEKPHAFWRLVNKTDEGYNGYVMARSDGRTPSAKLRHPDDRVKLGASEFLPFGDNTLHSLDGRYFGGVPLGSLIGPAFAVYWPFSERWGLAQ